LITSDIRSREREKHVSRRDVSGRRRGGRKRRRRNTPRSDITIISIAGERGAVRER